MYGIDVAVGFREEYKSDTYLLCAAIASSVIAAEDLSCDEIFGRQWVT